MNIFDQILASGYYAFNGKLNSHMIRMYITLERKSGIKFSREDLKMGEIDKYMEFSSNCFYTLKNGYTMSDIADYIDLGMIMKFYHLQKIWDEYHNITKESPTFEEAMKKYYNTVKEMVEEEPNKIKRY
ncbi:MAG: hypothetical protein IJ068_07715 [Bacilli bacterium]|nr:hypothetical protein [Bacilli bacterium]